MRALSELKEMLEDDVKKITKKGDISPDELNNVYKAIDIIKDIETIKAMREHGDYSQEGGSYGSYNSYNQAENSNRRPYYSYDGNSMDGGNSMGNSMAGNSMNSYDGSYDSSYARRGRDGDGDGRYSERRGRDAMGRYTSRDYSRHTDREMMIQKLEQMMQNAQTEEQKKAIMRCIDEM